jgi:hypothetical protein
VESSFIALLSFVSLPVVLPTILMT